MRLSLGACMPDNVWLAYWGNFHAMRPLNLKACWWIQSRFFFFSYSKRNSQTTNQSSLMTTMTSALKIACWTSLGCAITVKKNPVLGRFTRESAGLPSFLFLQTVLLLADGNDLAEWKESLFPMMPYFQTAWMWKKPSIMIYALSSISPYAAQSKFKNSMSKSWGGKAQPITTATSRAVSCALPGSLGNLQKLFTSVQSDVIWQISLLWQIKTQKGNIRAIFWQST